MHKFLVADIGGTNARFSLYFDENTELKVLNKIILNTDDYNSFEELLSTVLVSKVLFNGANGELNLNAVVIAAAGPIDQEGNCYPPNIKWKLTKKSLDKIFPKSKNLIINDFLAQSYAVLTPLIENCKEIKPGDIIDSGTIGVLGSGTGLGKSILSISIDGKATGLASEGGHCSFQIVDERDLAFSNVVKSKINYDYITQEDSVAGRALSYLYQQYYGKDLNVSEVSNEIKLGNAELVSIQYSKYLARICRDFALDIYSNKGIILAGGVLSKTPELLINDIFVTEFINSRTQKNFLEGVKIDFFANEDSGLWGAAKLASQFFI